VNAVERVATLDRAACRRRFEERFSVARMASAYAAIYQRLCRRESDLARGNDALTAVA
jgi:glycosyltransferase involved in cell wall biosynthesis